MRTALIVIYWLSLAVAGGSLLYLLFVFGHTETAPLSRVLWVGALAASGALVAGLLHWVGLPADPKDPPRKPGHKPSAKRSG